MNAIFFGCKRAFHGCLRIARQGLTGIGLTPARFDMLTAIATDPEILPRRQSDLRKALGVSAPTVSRMLKSLEELGLVRRARETDRDRRQRLVTLTERGLALLHNAAHHLIDTGVIQLAVDCALTSNRAHDQSLCLEEMDRAEMILDRIRRAFGDVATLDFPWSPDH